MEARELAAKAAEEVLAALMAVRALTYDLRQLLYRPMQYQQQHTVQLSLPSRSEYELLINSDTLDVICVMTVEQNDVCLLPCRSMVSARLIFLQTSFVSMKSRSGTRLRTKWCT